MNIFDLLQLLGGLILAVGYIPQIYQIVKTRSCKDLNLTTYISLFVGIGLMEAYAVNLVVNGSGTMFLVTNTISLVLVCIITILIVIYNRKEKEKNE